MTISKSINQFQNQNVFDLNLGIEELVPKTIQNQYNIKKNIKTQILSQNQANENAESWKSESKVLPTRDCVYWF